MSYTAINWQNGVTPINDNNLNKMDGAIVEHDEQLTASDNLKFRFATDGEGNYGYLAADGSFTPFKTGGGGGFVLTGTAFASNNSAGGNIYATGHVEFVLPKGTTVEFTAWNWYANGTKITSGFVTTEDSTTVYGEANSATGVRPKTTTNYTITFP